MDSVSTDSITKILTAAAAAPSGDNSQPWRFAVRQPGSIEFHAIPEKDNELLNVDESGTLFALGAALQNAELEAKSLGFRPIIRYGSTGTLVATMELQKGGELSEMERELEQAISIRHTNRKAYEKKPLTPEDRRALLEAAGDGTGLALSLITDAVAMGAASRALTTMEEVALQNKSLHRIFFESIFWSEERNAAGESGLYIQTLELPPPARLLFKVLPHWSVANLLAKIGFPKLVATINAKQNASASAFGVLEVDHLNRDTYVQAGRMLERIWLVAAARGMSLQIVTGMLFLARTIERENSPVFSDTEQAMIARAHAAIRAITEKGKEPFLMFRVGYAKAPTAVSFRKAPVVTYAT